MVVRTQALWRGPEAVDVAAGDPEGFSLSADRGMHFAVRSPSCLRWTGRCTVSGSSRRGSGPGGTLVLARRGGCRYRRHQDTASLSTRPAPGRP